jgi:hypothetical protein
MYDAYQKSQQLYKIYTSDSVPKHTRLTNFNMSSKLNNHSQCQEKEKEKEIDESVQKSIKKSIKKMEDTYNDPNYKLINIATNAVTPIAQTNYKKYNPFSFILGVATLSFSFYLAFGKFIARRK